MSASSTEIFYVSLHSALLKGFKVRVTTLDIKTGKQTGQNTLSSDSEIVSEASILYVGAHTAAPVLVWTDKNLKNIKINILGTSHITSLGVSSHGNEEVGHIAVHGPRSANAQPHFLVHYQTAKSNWAQVYHVDVSKRSVKRAYDLPSLGGKAAFSTSNIDSNVYFTRNSDFEVSLVSSASHGILERWPVRPKSHGGLVDPEGVEYAVSEVVSKDGSGFAVRSAATLSSGDWELIRNGDPVWTRPESLAGVVTAAWAELPKKHGLAEELAQESHSNLLTAYIHRVTRHINELRYFPSWIEGIPGRVITSFADPQVGRQNKNPQDDNFGLHKIVVVATEEGRLIALSTGNQGRIIWNINATYLPHGKRWDVLGIEVNKGVACVRAAGGEFLNVDVLAGKMLQRQASGSVPNLMTSISAVGMRGDTLRLALNMDGSPREIEVDRVGNTVVVTQRPDGAVLGWTSAKNAKPSIAWEFLPAFGETVSKVTTRPSHDPTASIGKALGDRNVLYKYLNPNLVIITAVNALTSTTSIYLLDSISGQTLYTTTHSDVDTSQSIPVVFSENWFAYSIFSDPSASALSSTQLPLPKSYQLIISELYESPLPNDRGPLGSASNFSSIHPTASPSTNTGTSMLTFPHVFSQAFVIPGHISHLSVTSTLQGITPRSILAVISSLNALISIPRGVIDPRRPINRDPTPAELEEGLFKYHPVLEFEPKWIVSHKRELMGLRKVITTPTMLESTSLVFAYGDVDVFGTRASPIGTFDLLGRGFSKAQLVVTVLALGTGTAVLGPMVSTYISAFKRSS